MLHVQNHKLLLGIILVISLLSPLSPYLSSAGESVHLDKTKLPKGCGSCHRGHGVFNTPMLREGRDVFCFRCHGSNSAVEEAKNEGYLARNVDVADIQREFNKPYRHPVEITGVHTRYENIPETNRSAERHAECVDCHHHHYASKDNKIDRRQRGKQSGDGGPKNRFRI